MFSSKNWFILIAVGIFIPAVLFLPGCKNKSQTTFIPINCYCAIQENELVLPYPKKYNFGTNGIWLQVAPFQTFPLKKEAAGLLWSPNGEQISVRVIPKFSTDIFISLPTRLTKSNYAPGETLDLPLGLHYFSRLTVTMPDGRNQEYAFGNIWLEILPKNKVDDQWEHYHYRLLKKAGYNPAIAIFYKNQGTQPVTLTGIHLPSQFPYSLDADYFWTETKPLEKDKEGEILEISETSEIQRLKPHLPLTKKVLAKQNINFPRPVTVEPGKEITLCFTLAATSLKAQRAFVEICPVIIRTAQGNFLANFLGPLSKGLPQDFDADEVKKMLES